MATTTMDKIMFLSLNAGIHITHKEHMENLMLLATSMYYDPPGQAVAAYVDILKRLNSEYKE